MSVQVSASYLRKKTKPTHNKVGTRFGFLMHDIERAGRKISGAGAINFRVEVSRPRTLHARDAAQQLMTEA